MRRWNLLIPVLTDMQQQLAALSVASRWGQLAEVLPLPCLKLLEAVPGELARRVVADASFSQLPYVVRSRLLELLTVCLDGLAGGAVKAQGDQSEAGGVCRWGPWVWCGLGELSVDWH